MLMHILQMLGKYKIAGKLANKLRLQIIDPIFEMTT